MTTINDHTPTLDDLCKRHGVVIQATRIPCRTQLWDDNRSDPPQRSHWHVLIRVGGKRLWAGEYSHGEAVERNPHDRVALRQGKWIHKVPKVADVLYCLLSDAQGADQPFEDWASDYGFDSDSRKALAIYETCVATHKALRAGLPSLAAFMDAASEH